MFDIRTIREHNFRGGVITDLETWGNGDIVLQGEFPPSETERSDCRFFYFRFGQPEPLRDLPKKLIGSAVTVIDISERDGGYSVKLSFAADSGESGTDFFCENIFCMLQRYKGMSYRNMYGTDEYNRYIEKRKYVLDEKYFNEQKSYDLPDDYTLETKTYCDVERQSKNYSVVKALLVKCALKKMGETVYEFLSTSNHVRPFTEFFTHRNGHKYYPFHIDLYGISYLELDTLRANNYIPEGFQHEHDYPFGESLIITDVHYDINTGMIAYDGCYWAGTADVMSGIFEDPMNFAPRIISLHSVIDSEYDLYDDVTFDRWEGNTIVVRADGKSVSVDISEITERLRTARK